MNDKTTVLHLQNALSLLNMVNNKVKNELKHLHISNRALLQTAIESIVEFQSNYHDAIQIETWEKKNTSN